MSGHSHAKTVAHKKQLEAEKRGAIFSKMARLISLAAKSGSNPETNSKLRQALEEARRFNMPKENIERAIKRGAGEIEGSALEEVSYEALGPQGILLIIEGITDNKNRAMLEVKQILQKYGGKIADEGSVKWAFERKGIIIAKPNLLASPDKKTKKEENEQTPLSVNEKESLELKLIESGAEDLNWFSEEEGELLEIITKPEDLEQIKEKVEKENLKIESASLGWIAKEEMELPEKERESCVKLLEELDESDTVQNVYSNLKL